jgi:hypothetical protein
MDTAEIRERYEAAYRSANNVAVRDPQQRHSRAHMYAVAQVVAAGASEIDVYNSIADLAVTVHAADRIAGRVTNRDHASEAIASISGAMNALTLTRIDTYATGANVGADVDAAIELLSNALRRISSGSAGTPSAVPTNLGV